MSKARAILAGSQWDLATSETPESNSRDQQVSIKWSLRDDGLVPALEEEQLPRINHYPQLIPYARPQSS
jgi:hypothetical protein